MNLLKSYYKINEKYMAFSLLGLLFFIYSFFSNEIIIKIIGLVCIILTVIFVLIFVLRLCLLKNDINNNLLVTNTIIIKRIEQIKINFGARQQFHSDYYGINIYTENGKYIFLYDKVLIEGASYDLYEKIKKQGKIKITYYKKSKVIKKVLTNI